MIVADFPVWHGGQVRLIEWPEPLIYRPQINIPGSFIATGPHFFVSRFTKILNYIQTVFMWRYSLCRLF